MAKQKHPGDYMTKAKPEVHEPETFLGAEVEAHALAAAERARFKEMFGSRESAYDLHHDFVKQAGSGGSTFHASSCDDDEGSFNPW